MSDMPMELRLKYLESARKLYKQEIVSPDFFADLCMALPESGRSILMASETSSLLACGDLLEIVSGIVITEFFNNMDDVLNLTQDEISDTVLSIREKGKEFVAGG